MQGIRDAVAALSPGDVGRVVVFEPRYGMYIVDGVVRHGAGGQPMIANVFLGTGGEIQRIYPSTTISDPSDPGTNTQGLGHGSTARVTFTSHPYGVFQVTGPITSGDDRFLMIGPWIVCDGETIAPRVVTIERFDEVLIHPANVPPLRSTIDQPTS